SARAERVDPEPADAGEGVREVGLVGPPELLHQVLTENLGDHALGVLGAQVPGLQLAQPAVDSDTRRRADLAVQVGTPAFHEATQEWLNRGCTHALGFGRPEARLDPSGRSVARLGV